MKTFNVFSFNLMKYFTQTFLSMLVVVAFLNFVISVVICHAIQKCTPCTTSLKHKGIVACIRIIFVLSMQDFVPEIESRLPSLQSYIFYPYSFPRD